MRIPWDASPCCAPPIRWWPSAPPPGAPKRCNPYQPTAAAELQDTTAAGTPAFTTVQKLNNAKLASAEAIVEAPSGGGVLPLANFGTTSFAGVEATSATGHTGTISDPAWSSVAITLSTRARGLRFTTDQGAGTAVPANLSPAGDAFAVTYQAAGTAPLGT